MAILNFPNTRQNGDPLQSGDQYTGDNGVTYIFDGVKWVGHAVAQPAGTNSITNNGHTVQINADGNLVIPNNATIVYASGDPVVTGGGGTDRLTSSTAVVRLDSNNTLYLPGDDQVSKISFSQAQGAYIGQGMGTLELQTGPSAYLQIQTDGGNKQWQFGADGSLTFPNGAAISSTTIGFSQQFPTNGAGQYSINAGSLTVGIPNPDWAYAILANPGNHYVNFDAFPGNYSITGISGPAVNTNVYTLTGNWPDDGGAFPIVITSIDYVDGITTLSSISGAQIATAGGAFTFDLNGNLKFPQGTTLGYTDPGNFVINGAQNKDVEIYTHNTSTYHGWTFGTNGKLTLPVNNFSGVISVPSDTVGYINQTCVNVTNSGTYYLANSTYVTDRPNTTVTSLYGPGPLSNGGFVVETAEIFEIGDIITIPAGVQGNSQATLEVVSILPKNWKFTQDGSTTFPDGTMLSAYGRGIAGPVIFPPYNSDFNISTNGGVWKFDKNGVLVFPDGATIKDSRITAAPNNYLYLYGGDANENNGQSVRIYASDAQTTSTDTVYYGGNIRLYGGRGANGGEGGEIRLQTYDANNDYNRWYFNPDASIEFPNNTLYTADRDLIIGSSSTVISITNQLNDGRGGSSNTLALSEFGIVLNSLNPDFLNYNPENVNTNTVIGSIINQGSDAFDLDPRVFGLPATTSTGFTGPVFGTIYASIGRDGGLQQNFGTWSVDGKGNLVTSNININQYFSSYNEPDIEHSVTAADITDRKGNSLIYVPASDTAPDHDINGLLWFNSQEGRIYVRYNDQWVDASPTVIPPSVDVTQLTNGENTVTLDTSGFLEFSSGGAVGNVQQTLSPSGNTNLPGIDLYATPDMAWAQLNYANTNYVWVDGSAAYFDVEEARLKLKSDGVLELNKLFGATIRLGEISDGDAVLWVDPSPDTEYLGLWWGGNTDYSHNGYGPAAGINIGIDGWDDSQDDVDPDTQINIGIGQLYWKFDANGVLNLPDDIGDIQRNGVSVLGGGGGFATTSTLVNGTYTVALSTTGQLNLPSAANTENNHARIQSANSIDILANTSTWIFGTDGGLALPNALEYANSEIYTTNGGYQTVFETFNTGGGRGAGQKLTLDYDDGAVKIQSYSYPNTVEWKFGQYGNLILPNGGIISETTSTVEIIPATANPGQSLVIRPTGVGFSITTDHPGGFVPGENLVITITNQNALGAGTVDYEFTGATSQQLGHSTSGTLTYTSSTTATTVICEIPANSSMTTFTFTLVSATGFVEQGGPQGLPTSITVTLDSVTFTENSHIHLVSGDPATVDLYLGDDDQYVKIEKDHGNVVIGTTVFNGSPSNIISIWTFDIDGDLTVPGNIKSQTIPQVGSIAVAGEPTNGYGGTLAIFVSGNFSSGSINDVSAGWTVTDGQGFTDTILSVGDPFGGSIKTTSVLWPTGGGRTYTFTSPDYAPVSANNLQIEIGSASWNFNTGGVLSNNDDGYLSLRGSSIGPTSRIHLRNTDNDPTSDINVHLQTGNASNIFELFQLGGGTTRPYASGLRTNSPTAPILIQTNNGGNSTSTWTFGADGSTTFPNDTILGTGSDPNVYIQTLANGSTSTWTFAAGGALTLPGSINNSTKTTTGSGDPAYPTAIDLTKTVNKLSDNSGSTYTLADGYEGQIMYLVPQNGASMTGVNVTVSNARILDDSSATTATVFVNASLAPFNFASTPIPTIGVTTLIFTDGAWQSDAGVWNY